MYKIEKLDHKGRGITFVDNKITFVENALKDEIVDIRLLNQKKKFNEAKVLSIITESVDRVTPICPYYKDCGGCNLMHLKYEKQLEYKKEKVSEILKRYGNLEISIDSIQSTSCLNYRNKVTLQVKKGLGFYKDNTYDIVEIDHCDIVEPRINEVIESLKNEDLSGIYQIVIRVSCDEVMVVFKTNEDLKLDLEQLKVDTIIMYKDGNYKTVKGKGYITETLENLKFIVSPDSFFQVNTTGALLLYNQVLEYASLTENENVLDLFCGTGTIGMFLSRKAKKVIGVEINQYAIEDAKKNAEMNGVSNIEFICDDATNVKLNGIDVVVVDPPRSGLNPKIIEYLLNLKSKKIIYVSCDPMTLARDLKSLQDGYDIKEVSLVDMFPNTYHVECVSVLHRKSLEK